jgi:putative chitinase
VKYKGRGLLLVTGRANYAKVSAVLGTDFVAQPEKLSEPENACGSAALH